MSNPSITADKTPWYQWDTGLTVTVSGGEMTECHFANRKQGTAYVQSVINGIARVPDELLQVAAPIKAYGYVSDGAGGQTYVEQTFDVIARNIPADYTYTKTAQKTIRDAETARDEAVKAANDAKASELAADDSAVEASNSAQSAGESASAAATSASNAANSAGDAAKSASDAKAAAGKAVEDASALLKTYTDNAKTSADNAATSARNAADAASSASGSESSAEQSATDANNAKVAAQTAKAEAETSASNAATSASNAAASATAAEKSASDAAASVNAINVIAPKTVATAAAASGTDSVAIGSGSSASKAHEFSIGNDNLTREITHVSTPTAQTSAATKKYTDDNDAKTLSEAKKYTDANTSNALVGNVSGKLLHVEDAWTGKPLGLTIDGACKQDGTPSPDNPVPIVVVENPTLYIAGKNLAWSYTVIDNIKKYSAVLYAFAGVCESGHFNVSFNSDAIGNNEYFNENLFTYVNFTVKQANSFSLTTVDDIDKSKPNQYHKKLGWVLLKNDADNKQALTVSNLQIEYGTEGTSYEPYNGKSVAITLPAEHPYLAALPDGTHDEIVIDKDGNASLVARVKVITTDDIKKATNYEEKANGADFQVNLGYKFKYGAGFAVSNICVDGNVDQYEPVNGGLIKGGYVRMTKPEKVTDIDSAKAYLIELGFVAYIATVATVTYSLGKLDIPSLPETISNVWTDAELTTNMSMTYKRDINIAFDNLVQSVVAAAAGE